MSGTFINRRNGRMWIDFYEIQLDGGGLKNGAQK
jgi:hypothetical protein